MSVSRFCWSGLAAAVLLVCNSVSRADVPSVSYIFPAGGQRGTTVSFNVGGHYLHEACPFQMLGPGVKAVPVLKRAARTVWFEGPVIPMPASQKKENYPKDQGGMVAIATDAPLGMRRWRVWTSQGVAPTMKFVIGDLPEIVEKEIDGNPIPMRVDTPVTINGRIFPREDIDIWTFEATKGQSYTCDVLAARIGSPLDSRLVVKGPGGAIIAENTDAHGTDSSLRFTAPADGAYQVHIHDIEYRGLQHFVYRLTITDGPYVDYTYPLGGRRGAKVPFELAGQRLPMSPVAIQLPKDKADRFEHRIRLEGAWSNSFPIELSDLPEHLEAEPNEVAAKAQMISLPAVCNGRIGQAGDVDRWRFKASKGDALVFDVRAARLGSPLDSVLTISGPDGKELARSDDMNKNQSDSRLQFKIPADGTYAVAIHERFANRGGRRFAYRLHIAPPAGGEPDFELSLPTDGLTLNRGAEAKIKVTAFRHGGFDSAIELKVNNLPKGVTLKDVTIPAKKTVAELKFLADASAKIQGVPLKVIGVAKAGDSTITRTAVKTGNSAGDMDVDHLFLAVSLPTPFKVKGIFETKYAARGSTYLRQYTIDRGGFKGPITVSMADRQVRHLQGVAGPTIVVPPGESRFEYPIWLAPWMEVGRTSRTCVMAVAVVEEPDGAKHKVSHTSHEQADQIIVLVNPGQLALRVRPGSLLAKPGQTAQLKIQVGRGQGLQLPIKVDLVIPDHIHGVKSEPKTLPAGQSIGILKLSFAPGKLGPFNQPLTIRATAMSNGQPYTAESKVQIVPAFD